jgi:hypothetical protein
MRTAVSFLLLAAWASLGCESLPRLWDKPQPPPAKTVAVQPAKLTTLVTAEQISDTNAQDMAGALLDELDRDAQGEPIPATAKPVGETKPTSGKHR